MIRAWQVLFLSATAACAADTDGHSAVSVQPGLIISQDLLAEITTLHLQVFDTMTGVTCDAATGALGGPSPTPKPLDQATLGTTSCPAGSGFKFCGTVTVTQSKTDLVFAAVGDGSSNQVVAQGCARATINGPTETVDIKMMRVLPTAVCGDGTVEPGETCDPGKGTDPLCSATCQTAEIAISPASTYSGGPTAPAVNERTTPFFLWPSGMGPADYFFAFFGDHFSGRAQVSMAVRSDSLLPVTTLGPAAQGGSLFLPNGATFPPPAAAFDQSNPTAAVLGTTYFVAFQDDAPPSNGIDVHLRSMDDSLDANQTSTPCGINGPNGAGEAGVQSDPQMAAALSGSVLFVVWQDESAQAINGRTYTAPASAMGCGTLGAEETLSTGSNNAHGVVAATPNGWVVAWQSGSNVVWQALDATGTPMGTPEPVGAHTGAQDHPSVAALQDGSFAIAWNDHTTPGASAVFAQRFSTSGQPLAGDSSLKVDDLSTGDETAPTIASTTAAGGAYVVAWVDSGSPNQVRARFLAGTSGSLGDGSGYLFNTVDGSASEFQVSVTPGRTRANPTIAVGGAGPYVAFGWEDQSAAAGSSQPGIIGRRFPAPTP